VRQKLLEHVAAALTLQPQASDQNLNNVQVQRQPFPTGENTPPRSPTKSTSPQRLANPVKVTSPEPMSRRAVESIRIYADLDVYALMADVEKEINRMGDHAESEANANAQEQERERGIEQRPAPEAGITLSAVAYSGIPTSTTTGKALVGSLS